MSEGHDPYVEELALHLQQVHGCGAFVAATNRWGEAAVRARAQVTPLGPGGQAEVRVEGAEVLREHVLELEVFHDAHHREITGPGRSQIVEELRLHPRLVRITGPWSPDDLAGGDLREHRHDDGPEIEGTFEDA